MMTKTTQYIIFMISVFFTIYSNAQTKEGFTTNIEIYRQAERINGHYIPKDLEDAVRCLDSLLTDEEKIALCDVVSRSGADFIKTSTGFSTGGATREDVALFKKYVKPGLGIKAAGGIANLKDAEDFLALGATRLGTSRLVKIAKEQGA